MHKAGVGGCCRFGPGILALTAVYAKWRRLIDSTGEREKWGGGDERMGGH